MDQNLLYLLIFIEVLSICSIIIGIILFCKEKNISVKKIFINHKNIILIIIFTIFIGLITFKYYEIKQTAKVQEESQKLIDQLREDTNENLLDECISEAKTSRTNLYKANSNNDGKVSNTTSKMIEDRYNKDIDLCFKRYQ